MENILTPDLKQVLPTFVTLFILTMWFIWGALTHSYRKKLLLFKRNSKNKEPKEKCENCGRSFYFENITSINNWNFKGRVCKTCLHELRFEIPKHNYRICKTIAGTFCIQKAELYPFGWRYDTITVNGTTYFSSPNQAQISLEDIGIDEVVKYL